MTNLPAISNAPDVKNPFSNPEIASPVKKRRRSQPLILVIVIGTSVGAIFGMRQYVLRTGVALASPQIDYKGQDAERARTYERIMTELNRVQAPLEVARCEFAKSPFMLDLGETAVQQPTTNASGPGKTPEQLAAEAEAHRTKELNMLAEALKLQSVMGGKSPLARINDHTLRIGDKLEDLFVVVSIDGRSVTLDAEGRLFVLTMETGNNNEPKRPPAGIGGRGGSPR